MLVRLSDFSSVGSRIGLKSRKLTVEPSRVKFNEQQLAAVMLTGEVSEIDAK